MTPALLRSGYRAALVAAFVIVVLLLGAMSLNPSYNFWR